MDLRGMRPDRFLKRVRQGLESRDDRVLGNLAVERGLLSRETLDRILRLPEVRSGGFPVEKALAREANISASQMESLLEEQRRHELLDFLQTRTESLPPEVEEAEFDEERNLGRYLLVESIGRGSSAEVWKSWDRQMARWVAIKLLRTDSLHPETVSRFQREAGFAGKLRHPNIVTVHDTGTWNERMYLVMDLIEHGDLEQASLQGQTQIAEVMEKVARAVQTAHEQGVIHRDLKPGNILMDDRGEPLVTDFGLARSEREVEKLTRTGSVIGTPLYMAPEQVLGSGIDPRTDVYAMGTILYELLTGQRAFEGTALGEIFNKITSGPLPPSPRTVKPVVSSDLERVCLRAMAREPADRYESAREFADDLARFRQGLLPLARPLSFPGKALRWGKRNPLPAVLSLAIVLIGFIGSGIFLTSRSEHETRLSALRRAQRAAQAYAAGNHAAAGWEAAEAIRLDPNIAEGHFWAGRVFFHDYFLRRPLPTVAIFIDEIRFIPPRPESPEEKALLEKARSAFREISPDRFKGEDEWQWEAARGMLALVGQKFATAEERLRRARKGTPDREIAYLHALALYYQNRFGDAEKVLNGIAPPRDGIVEVARIKVAHALAIEAEKAARPAGKLHDRALDLCLKFAHVIDPETLAALEAHVRTTRAFHLHTTGEAGDQKPEFDRVIFRLEALPKKTVDSELAIAKVAMIRGQIAFLEWKSGEAKLLYRAGLDALDRLDGVAPPPLMLPLVRANLLVLRATLWSSESDDEKAKRDAEEAGRMLDRLDPFLADTPNVVLIRARLATLARPRPGSLEDGIRILDAEIVRAPGKPALLIGRAGWLGALAEAKRFAGENPRLLFLRAHRDIRDALASPPVTHALFDAENRLATNVFLAGTLPPKGTRDHVRTLSKMQEILKGREPGSHRIPYFQALIHLFNTLLLRKSGDPAEAEFRAGLKKLESVHGRNGKNDSYLSLLCEAWFRFGLYRHSKGESPLPQVEKALEAARERGKLRPLEISVAVRLREILLMRANLIPPGTPIDWEELEEALADMSRFVEKSPDNPLPRMTRANFAYQFAILKNNRGREIGELVDLVVRDATKCMKHRRHARQALMLRALIRGMEAIRAAARSVVENTEKNIAFALDRLNECGKDFETVVRSDPGYAAAHLYRAEMFFTALSRNPDGFIQEGGGIDRVTRLLMIIYRDLTVVLAPSDNSQASLLRAQVRLLELFITRGKASDEDRRILARNCRVDAKKGESFQPATGRYVGLAARFFEFQVTPPVSSPDLRALQRKLGNLLRKHPELKSDQSDYIERGIMSALERED